jgi:hypothetical protein
MASTGCGACAQVEAFSVGDPAVSRSAWEQQALDSIKNGLAASDPKLAGLLSAFSRLASGEEMPAREAIRVARRPRRKPRWRRADQVSRHVQQVRQLLGSRRPALLLWLAITVILIAVALALSSGNAPASCTYSWAMGCATSAPAPGSPTGLQATTADLGPRSSAPGAGG